LVDYVNVPATARSRLKYLGEGFINSNTVKSLNPKSFLSYLKAINLTITLPWVFFTKKTFQVEVTGCLTSRSALKTNVDFISYYVVV
jgi:hypothetical protein